jgi:hypothetical protein
MLTEPQIRRFCTVRPSEKDPDMVEARINLSETQARESMRMPDKMGSSHFQVTHADAAYGSTRPAVLSARF